ncbi:MAG: DUF1553 domain-containing protein [Verrucomicrobiaceae bacterium]
MKPVLVIWIAAASTAIAEVGYNRDVRPILSDRCFKCHGFDAATRKADLRLDVRDEAIQVIESGDLLARITSTDPEEVMPPPKDHAPLKSTEVTTLKQWIAEGAKYEAHWAFVPPKNETNTSIDEIVRQQLQSHGLKPSPPADDATLRRRVSLVLTGLPSHEAQKSYSELVDALLASPHFGERLALDWLDAARYADTHGLYTDGERQAWPWRDWVIRAFNENMPFDRFTIEQLAGDLLLQATLDQKIATAFNRNHTVTNETGIIDEEYRVSYVADRVETTAATWLGLTMGCAKCHDHKFDPLTMRDYYALFAAFNNLDEKGIIKDVASPVIELPTEDQKHQIAGLAAKRQKLESSLKTVRPALDREITAWEPKALRNIPVAPSKGESAHFSFDSDHHDHGPKALQANVTGKTTLKPGVKGSATMLDATQYVDFADPWPLERDRAFTLSVWINPGSSPQGCVASKQDSDSQARGFEILWYKAQPRINLAHRYGSDGIEVVAKDKFSGGQWRHLVITYDGSSKAAGLKVYVDGKLSEVDVRRDSLSGSIASKEPWRIGWKGTGIGFEGGMDEFRLFDRAITAEEVTALHWREFLEGTLAIKRDQRPKSTAEKLESYFIDHYGTPELKQLSRDLAQTRAAEADAKKSVISLAVMQEMPKPRETRLLTRGQYDQPADAVSFAVPVSLGKLGETMPRNRLGLAQWLVSKDNPLTARVMVNRLWTLCFGDGLVRTPNDFGLQGEAPTNAALLDFLAVRFRDGDAHTKPWDIKALLKLIVTSETFRQSSNFTPELLARDPDNRLLARGPRFRLPAEVIRDQALAVSGLLVPTIGGPSVKPPQPPGLWEAVSYNGEASYTADTGAATHRRGLYTFWKRQSPPPDMLTLDGPTREVCTVRRPRTNTPLQALLLLNDENYLEAARALAQLILKEKDHRIEWAFHRVTGRHANARELAALRTFFNAQRIATNETQAWTMLASLLMNLDEVQTLH